MATSEDTIREVVRERYAAAATAAARGDEGSCGCGDGCGPALIELDSEHGDQVFGNALYAGADTERATAAAVQESLGCGVPTQVADLQAGETVLDLGSGAAVLISARRVGPTGRAIGLDMTDEMLELARRNAEEARTRNVDFVKGHMINRSADEGKVLAEATRADMAAWTGCVAGALTREEFAQTLAQVGLVDVEIHETHRVHEHASSAIVRARKPL
jgi:arsenite methyltransferase